MKHSRYDTLFAFCLAMEWAPDLQALYQRIVDVATEFFECDAAYLHLLDINGQALVRYASRPDEEPEDVSFRPISTDVGRMKKLLETGELIVMEDYENPHVEDEIPPIAVELGFRSAVSIPLNSPSGVLGMLTAVYRKLLPWSQDDQGFLLDIGRVLGVLIQRVWMSKKDVELQMLHDRKQISSEIHDNVSQVISALTFRAEIALECLNDGDYDGLSAELESVAEQARQVTKVLREEMLSLRTPIDGPGDLEENLSSLLGRFEAQWGISTRFEILCEEKVFVSEYVYLQLARIVNECLQNILRHSRASEVVVTLDRKNGSALISIRDNGVGFNPDAVAPERLGLRIMRERAKLAGGTASIVSGSQGTAVFVDVPALFGRGAS